MDKSDKKPSNKCSICCEYSYVMYLDKNFNLICDACKDIERSVNSSLISYVDETSYPFYLNDFQI